MSQTNSPSNGDSAQNATEDLPLQDPQYSLTVISEDAEAVVKCNTCERSTVHYWKTAHAVDNTTGLPKASKRLLMCSICGTMSLKN